MKRLFDFVGQQFEKFGGERSRVNEADKFLLVSSVENLEQRYMLSAIFPAYVDGVFTLGDPTENAPYGYANTFLLESNPTATKTIYLDYNGHHSVNNSWGHNIVFPSFDRNGNPNSFSNTELAEIQKQWQNVAEDYLPFDVNVATLDPGVEALRKTSSGDQEYGIRVVNTQATGGFGNGIGGVAFLHSFDDSIDNPAFTFNKGINNGGMTNSHEAGHTLGLFHDGLFGQEYHPGTGTGATGWGPIMGAPFGKNLTMWSDGNYNGSTNQQDDLQVITRASNGFGFRADDHGGAPGTATFLGSGTVFQTGFIGDRLDLDFFEIDSGDGNLVIDIQPFGENPDLDIEATLFDDVGNVIATSNPLNDIDASFNETVTAGTYYLMIDGTGKPGVYDDYGSLGFYSFNATIPDTPVDNEVGESGQILNLTDQWRTVNFSRPYDDPIVTVSPARDFGAEQTAVRIRNVTSTSFQVQLKEWDYLNGTHTGETVSFLVVERGIHTLQNGAIIEAGSTNINHGWRTVNLNASFSSTPAILTTVADDAGASTTVVRMRNATSNSFDYRIQEEEANNDIHATEIGNYIAWEVGTGDAGIQAYEAGIISGQVTHNMHTLNFTQSFASAPAMFTATQTYNGPDPVGMRIRSTSTTESRFFLEEEQSFDSEVAHTTETVGYLAVEIGSIDGPSNIPRPPQPWVVTYIQDKDPFGEGEWWSLGCEHSTCDSHGAAGINDGGCGCPLCAGQVNVEEIAANMDGFEKLTVTEQFAVAHRLINSSPTNVASMASTATVSNAGALDLAVHETPRSTELSRFDFEVRDSTESEAFEIKTLSDDRLSLVSI